MRTTAKFLTVFSRLAWTAFLLQLVIGFFADFTALWGWLLIAAALAARFTAGRITRPSGERRPVEVAPPVTGRWMAGSSPADRVPSHGTRAYGQAYAIDLVAEPEDRARPGFGWWPPVRRNPAFPSFGAPVLAVAEGTVVRATDWRRDHLSRNSWPALPYLFAESLFRDTAGPGWLIGNHLVLDLGGGVYALYAHLQRGSLAVRAGDRVSPGRLLARCGNSGNSSEPHVHFQLMDGPDPDTAHGIPFTWPGIGVPARNQHFTAPEPATP
ncbi:M23 family metallopeptidase [Streptomyces sp. YIM 98790]|uniref:M23 family metallopeptidase n=1 Tax=Streptomyces sp. YIM 98790 TaxID=2689077 RepID=UPI0014092F53|nr:M23 family metallopeptidase [Streptomyces sp. YIM 98790]